MYVTRSGQNLIVVSKFAKAADLLASPMAKREMYRGVVDAGRLMKTETQKVVTHQMALKPGMYVSYVVANTRGVGSEEALAYDIYGIKGGIKVENYRGLKAVSLTARLNKRSAIPDRGMVRSSVWNNPRVFKRSFEFNGKFYMMRSRQAGVKAPRMFWTHDNRAWQPRSAGGKFASTGATWGKVRLLYGPSLMKEIPDGESAANFMARAPAILEFTVAKRLQKLMRF